jgi:hypothetical protein
MHNAYIQLSVHTSTAKVTVVYAALSHTVVCNAFRFEGMTELMEADMTPHYGVEARLVAGIGTCSQSDVARQLSGVHHVARRRRVKTIIIPVKRRAMKNAQKTPTTFLSLNEVQ